jgi:hypothetical protein
MYRTLRSDILLSKSLRWAEVHVCNYSLQTPILAYDVDSSHERHRMMGKLGNGQSNVGRGSWRGVPGDM